MNQSFEVILTHEEFTRYKELEKENERNCRAMRDLRQQNEKATLTCQQLEATVAAHELKIKELSKTTLRLSRKILFEEEEHQKTQEHFLAREQQLLQKLLAATNNSQNALNSMKKDKESKEKTAQNNSRLQAKLAEMEKNMENMKNEIAIEKNRARQAENKCALCERELTQVARTMNGLKAQLEQMSNESLRLSQESRLICEQLTTLRLTLEEQTRKQEQLRQLVEQQNTKFEEQKAGLEEQIRVLQSLLGEQIIAYDDKQTENNQLRQECSALLSKNQSLNTKMSMVGESVAAIRTQLTEQKQQTKRQLQDYTKYVQQLIAQIQTECSQQLLQQKMRILSKEEAKSQFWNTCKAELSKCHDYLLRDKIYEWKAVLKLQLQQIGKQFAGYLSTKLQEWLNDC